MTNWLLSQSRKVTFVCTKDVDCTDNPVLHFDAMQPSWDGYKLLSPNFSIRGTSILPSTYLQYSGIDSQLNITAWQISYTMVFIIQPDKYRTQYSSGANSQPNTKHNTLQHTTSQISWVAKLGKWEAKCLPAIRQLSGFKSRHLSKIKMGDIRKGVANTL